MIVKMYGWFAAYYPLASAVGSDIYDDTRSQVYLYNSEKTVTTQAINAIGSQGMDRSDNNELFLTEYSAGTYDGINYKESGIMSQEGTRYWADNGKDWFYMNRFYFNNSSKVGGTGKLIHYFSLLIANED